MTNPPSPAQSGEREEIISARVAAASVRPNSPWARRVLAGHYDHDDAVLSALAALRAPAAPPSCGVPAGWKLVPVEPTKAMIQAGIDAAEKVEDYSRSTEETYRCDTPSDMPKPIYRAMLAAAPEAPTASAQASAAQGLVEALEELRSSEGNSVMILCDDPEAESVDRQTAIDVNGDWTDWQDRRFYGATIMDALQSARAAYRAASGEERCSSCDGTGDIIELDGEWRGYCNCPAGEALRSAPPATDRGDA